MRTSISTTPVIIFDAAKDAHFTSCFYACDHNPGTDQCRQLAVTGRDLGCSNGWQVTGHVDLGPDQRMVLEGMLAARVVSPEEAAACGQHVDTAADRGLWIRDPGLAQSPTCIQLQLLPGQV